jgi:hypothetical protein
VTEPGGGQGWRDRAFHRLTYAEPDRPPLQLDDGTRGAVVDCSEMGIRYRPHPRDPLPSFGAIVEGRVEFRAAGPTRFTGRVIRVSPAEVALYLPSPGNIPFRAILAEQRDLRARYPFDKDGG